MPRTNLEDAPPSKPAYFWWLLANALALCFAIISWVVCLDVFGHPEQARNYKILSLLKRIPEPKRYTILDVPNGNSFSPKDLYARFFGHSDEKLDELNSLLMRNYLTNFDNTALLTYVEGTYQIIETRKLTPADLIGKGFAFKAQALVKPDDFTKPLPYPVMLEYILPTDRTQAMEDLKENAILEIKKSPQCAAVIRVSREVHDSDPVLCLTVIPIAYGPYHLGEARVFPVEPPERLQLDAEFPLFKPTPEKKD
ncbi:MAG: hypothetical protein QM627_10285 [Luteolibacter sp.]